MISANGGLPAHRYTPQVTQRWPRGSEPASPTGLHLMKQLIQILQMLTWQRLHFAISPFGRHSCASKEQPRKDYEPILSKS